MKFGDIINDFLSKKNDILVFEDYLELAEILFDGLGWVCIPVSVFKRGDKYTKKPIGKWGELASNPPQDKEELRRFWLKSVSDPKLIKSFGEPSELTIDPKVSVNVSGLAVLTGKISGITVIDIDDVEKFITTLEIKELEALANTLTTRTPRGGLHLFGKYDEDFPQTAAQAFGFDIRNDGGFVVIPPSRVIDEKDPSYLIYRNKEVEVFPDWLKEKILTVITPPKPKKVEKVREKKKELTPQDISTIVESLYPVWLAGHRHQLTISLIGWLMKNGVPKKQVERVISDIALKAGDEEEKQRLYQVEWHYQKRQELINRLKGWSGIEEVLDSMVQGGVITQEAALNIKERLQKIFNDRDAFDVLIRTSENPPAGVGNIRTKRGIYEWKVKDDVDFRLTKKIASFYIEELEIIDDYFNEERHFSLRGITETGEQVSFSGDLRTICSKIRKKALSAVNIDKLETALAQIIVGFQKKGKAKVSTKPVQVGIFPKKEERGLIFNLPNLPEELDRSKVANALTILDVFVSVFSQRKIPQVATTVKFAIAAPFYFARKVLTKRPFRYLYLIGVQDTAKTSDMRMAFYIWGEEDDRIVPLTAVATPPRLARRLGETTLPLIIDEAEKLFPPDPSKDDLRLILKATWSGKVAHSYYTAGGEKQVKYALSALGFTSNFAPSLTPPERKRIKVISYPKEAQVSAQEIKEFQEFMNQQTIETLAYIGKAIVSLPELWLYDTLMKVGSFEEFGTLVLKKLYSEYTDFLPEWIEAEAEEAEDIVEKAEYTPQDIATVILKYVIKTAAELDKSSIRDCSSMGLRVFDCLLQKAEIADPTLPVATYTAKIGGIEKEMVVLRRKVLDWLKQEGIEVPSLKDLADIAGGSYSKVSVRNRGWVGLKAAILPKELFIEVLPVEMINIDNPPEEEDFPADFEF